MTYPPQPPDAPYGQQPSGGYGPYGQQPQSPGAQQPYGAQQPGGYPAQPPYGSGQFDQPPAYGQGYGQYAPPPWVTPDEPRKKRTGLIIGIAAAAVVVLAGAGVGTYFLFFANAQSSPESVGRAVVDALNAKNEARILDLSCDSYRPRLKMALDQSNSMTSPGAALKFTYKSVAVDSDKATVTFHYEGSINGETKPAKDETMDLRKDPASGKWTVCPKT
ncbi:MAG: hypothetical protein JOZ47_08590 [Kutzneria sp.]|nr:hypothetical protein [Kutzneria sp.]